MKRQAPRLVIAAPGSGSGKTLAVCGILTSLLAAGKKPAALNAVRIILIPCSMKP